MYYLRTSPAVNPINFGIDIDDLKRLTGMNSVDELISHSIADANIFKKRKRENSGSDKSTDSDSNKNNNQENEENDDDKPIMCKYIPGKVAEGCFMCSS